MHKKALALLPNFTHILEQVYVYEFIITYLKIEARRRLHSDVVIV